MTTEEECSYHFSFEKPTNDLSSQQANIDGNFPYGEAEKGLYFLRTIKVGSYPPNKLGLYDMHGNVLQWTDRLWEEMGTARVCRVGSWDFAGDLCEANVRRGNMPDYKSCNLGFRRVRVPD